MTAKVLPIDELNQAWGKIEAEARGVAVRPKNERPGGATALVNYLRTWILRYKLSGLVVGQKKVINTLVDADFSQRTPQELEKLASQLESLASFQKDTITQARNSTSDNPEWWDSYMSTFWEMAEHLESIADSLRVACDDKASSLLAFSASQLAQN